MTRLRNIVYRKILSIFGYWISSIPQSGGTDPVYLVTKSSNSRLSNMGLIASNALFEFNYYYQKNDFRGLEKSDWNEETTRILAMYKIGKFFSDFDFFDIGANYGLYSLPLVANGTGARVLLEPNPFIYKCLKKTFNETEFELLNMGITCGQDMLSMQLMPHCSGGSSSVFKPRELLGFAIDVPGIGYEKLLKERKTSDKLFLKIDIEGAEIELLNNGFLNFISQNYNTFILFIELIGTADPDLLQSFQEHFGDMNHIVLSNNNWKNINHMAGDGTLRNNKNSLKEFYTLRIDKGLNFMNEPGFCYADLIISNDENALKQLFDVI